MESVNNDILQTIVSYTTPGVSLNVLTAFVPREVYRDATWRRKTLVESRGLVVDDDVIKMVGDGGWYAYYLSENKTYCGDVLEVKVARNRFKSNIKTQDVIYYEVIFTTGTHKITVVQNRNLSIKIKNRNVKGINRKIRQVVYLDQPVNMLAILDEFGEVWLYNVRDSILEDIPAWGHGIVAMHIQDYPKHISGGSYELIDQPLMFLDRAGRLHTPFTNDYLKSPKVVSFLNVGYTEMATLSNGRSIQIKFGPYEWKYRDDIDMYGHKVDPGELYLNGFITTKLRPAIYPRLTKVVQLANDAESSAYLKKDRTAHILVQLRDGYVKRTVEASTNRTQTVMLVQSLTVFLNKVRYFIVDPN